MLKVSVCYTSAKKGRKMAYKKVLSHRDLEVYQLSFSAAKEIFKLTRNFPREERYALTDQILRSSRSVCANLTEAWRRRRYRGEFIMRLNYSEAEAAETQTWLDLSLSCGYISEETHNRLHREYDHILGKVVNMIARPSKWLLPPRK